MPSLHNVHKHKNDKSTYLTETLVSRNTSSTLTSWENDGLFLWSAFQHSNIQLYTVSGQSCSEGGTQSTWKIKLTAVDWGLVTIMN